MTSIKTTSVHDFPDQLREIAQRSGALAAACTTPAFFNPSQLNTIFDTWLEHGNGERLHYIRKNCEVRKTPFKSRAWAAAAIVVVFQNQWCTEPPSTPSGLPLAAHGAPVGRIAAYAAGSDYHRTGHRILEKIARELDPEAAFQYEIAVDTAPVPDTFMAIATGLGRRGANGLLRTSQFASRVFVGTLFTAQPLPPVIHTPDHPVPVCADCKKCIHVCPTDALDGESPITVARCRSFLSMEHRGAFDAEQIRMLGNALFGCDVCTSVCPPTSVVDSGEEIDLLALLKMSSNQIKRIVQSTALAYAGPTLLRRNAIANLANSGHPDARATICELRKSTRSDTLAQTADAALAGDRISLRR
jgi:epoxyqueuosine reductase